MIERQYLKWVQSMLFNFEEVFGNWKPRSEIEAESIAELIQSWMEDPQIQKWARDLFILTLEALTDEVIIIMEENGATNRPKEVEDWVVSRGLDQDDRI